MCLQYKSKDNGVYIYIFINYSNRNNIDSQSIYCKTIYCTMHID